MEPTISKKMQELVETFGVLCILDGRNSHKNESPNVKKSKAALIQAIELLEAGFNADGESAREACCREYKQGQAAKIASLEADRDRAKPVIEAVIAWGDVDDRDDIEGLAALLGLAEALVNYREYPMPLPQGTPTL